MNACCTKVECVCQQIAVTFKLDEADVFTQSEIDAFKLVITDKSYVHVDSLDVTFQSNTFDLYEGSLPSYQRMEDHHLILKNSVTGSADTISFSIVGRTPYNLECNKCFLRSADITPCEKVTSEFVRQNGQLASRNAVTISR